MKYVLGAIVIFIFVLGQEYSDYNYIKKYYSDFSIIGPYRKIILFNKLKQNELKGNRYKKLGIRNGSVIYKNYSDTEGEKKYIEVYFNNYGKPVKIIRKNSYVQVLEVSYDKDNRPSIYKMNEKGGEIKTIFSYNNEKISFVEIRDGDNLLLSSENYYYHSNEIKIISFFSRGRLKSMGIYKETITGRLFYKYKNIRQVNVDFIAEGVKNGLHYGDDHEYLNRLKYDSFSNWDMSVVYKSPYISVQQRLIKVRGENLIENYYSNNVVVKKVELLKKCKDCSVFENSWKIYDDHFSKWEDYIVTEYDDITSAINVVHYVKNGLMLSTVYLEDNQEVLRDDYSYYPDRNPMEVRRFIYGDFYRTVQSKDRFADSSLLDNLKFFEDNEI